VQQTILKESNLTANSKMMKVSASHDTDTQVINWSCGHVLSCNF